MWGSESDVVESPRGSAIGAGNSLCMHSSLGIALDNAGKTL